MQVEITRLLVGEQLSSVEFVQDYLQLHFDGRTLTCYIWPRLCTKDEVKLYGMRGYRDLLCELIAQEVERVIVVEQKCLELYFVDSEYAIVLDLGAVNHGVTGEVATLKDSIDGTWFIFE